MIDCVLDVRFPSFVAKLFEQDPIENGCVVYCVEVCLKHVGIEIPPHRLADELNTNKAAPGTRWASVEKWLSCQRIAYEAPFSPTRYVMRKKLAGLQVPAVWATESGNALHAVVVYGVRRGRLLAFDPSVNLKKEWVWRERNPSAWTFFILGNTFVGRDPWRGCLDEDVVPPSHLLADLSRGLRTLGLRLKRNDPIIAVLREISGEVGDSAAELFLAMLDDVRNGEMAMDCLPVFLDILPFSVARVLREGENTGKIEDACLNAANMLDQMPAGR